MRGEENVGRHNIPESLELATDLTVHTPIAQRQQAWDVLEEECLGAKLVDEPQVMPEELVARIVKEPLRRVDREALAGRTPYEDV